MIELRPHELERSACSAEIVPEGRVFGALAEGAELRRRAQIRDHDDLSDAGKLREHLAHRRERVDGLAGVEVAVRREQHLRGYLPEAVQHAVDAEVRRAGGPDGAQARRGQHGDDRLGQVRHEARYTVALAHARRLQARRDARDFLRELTIGKLAARAALVAEHDGGLVVPEPEQVLREVEARPRKELRARHVAGIGEHRAVTPVRAHVGEARELRPELLRLRDGPGVEVVVARQGQRAARVHAADEAGDVGFRDALGGRRP